MNIKESFIRFMEEAIGHENALVAFSAFDAPASTAVRYNPFKECRKMDGRMVPWCSHGYILPERPLFTLDPLFHAGGYYVQDSSSMFVGHAFRKVIADMELPAGRPLRILDLCAAPGGKTTDLAASSRERFGGDYLLVANEVMKARVGILADNVALWGDPNVVVSSDDPAAFASLSGFFDIIVTDVPCSGEGMFRKDEEALQQWSEDNVALCQARQRRILADVWPALREGGILLYSTCTFNRLENDGNVAWTASELGAEVLTQEDIMGRMPGVLKTEMGYSLVPGHVEGEGQYCAVLRKTVASGVGSVRIRSRKPQVRTVQIPDGLQKLMNVPVVFRTRGETITAVPQNIASEVAVLEDALHVVAAGCAVGVVKGKDLVPDADLALSIMLDADAFASVETDRMTALGFLHRDAVLFPEAPRGYLLVRYEGLGLGFVKNLGNRCNSLHPQSRRIRMDIK
ncbi:MAG: rRNA cytosine-C5-methyltransferase [Bacteroidales bacterium]|nr:rRNA cytosine-C5-methyltransferase [Bacteroidales bacterium]